MRISPRFMGFMYLIIGGLFTTLAIQAADNGIWNFSTIIFMIMATLDFGIALKIFFMRNRVNKGSDSQ